MQQTLLQLIETEKICGEIDRLDAELSRFPAEYQRIADELTGAEGTVAAARARLENESLEERRLESQMRDQEALILKLNQQTGQVSSNQAYTALLHELEAAEAAKSKFEVQALEHMEAIDAAKKALALEEQKLASLRSLAPDKTSKIDARKKVVEDERQLATSMRDKACEGLDPKVMKRFEAVRVRKRPAVAIMTSNSCPECKMVLPRIRYSEINRLVEIFDCSSCRRILAPRKVLEASGPT